MKLAVPPRIAVIVTEYPKSTETFIYRDLVKFAELGAEIRLYHLAPFRRDQTLHAFAEPTRGWARYIGFAQPAAFARAAHRHPAALAKTIAQITRAYAATPRIAAKSLALLPKSLAIAEDARAWGATHVHAEFAGHPATAAWIGRRMGGLPYSVSCRAHDIFRTQGLLAEKLGEAAMVRTVSDFGAAFLRRAVPGMATRDIQVIHSSVDVTRIAPVEDTPSLAPFRILYVGALEPKKGVEHLLDALVLAGPHLGDWRCEAIGHGPSADALRRRAADLGLAGRIAFRGIQPFEAVTEAYRQASVCVAPSVIGPDGRQEGIPNVMIEALAYQRPAITTNISGIPELIRDGDTGLLVPLRDAPSHAIPGSQFPAYPDPTRWNHGAGSAVVLVDADGTGQAIAAAAILRSEGIGAEVLEGGFTAWTAHGLPTIMLAHLPPRHPDGRTWWVTRARPKVDRIACPWFIRRFVDPDARFLFVPPGAVLTVARHEQAEPFDIADDGVVWTHRGDRCTFDALVEGFGLATHAPLVRLAAIVRGADTDRFDLAPEAAGLLAISLGLSRLHNDDHAQLDAGMAVYDALYRWCRDAQGERHDWSSHQPARAKVPA